MLGTVYFLFQSVLVEVPLKVQNRQHKETKLLTYQKVELVPEDSTDNPNVEQIQEGLAEVPLQTGATQEPLLEELKEPTVEVPDSAEPTKEDPDTVESSTEQCDLYAQRCKEYQRE